MVIRMILGVRDFARLLAISVIACCAVFVCTLFLNYNLDLVSIGDTISSQQGQILYQALLDTGKVVSAVSGGCLVVTAALLLLFYIKNFIDSHGKELGILKALGYSNFQVARRFWVFGLSILLGCALGLLAAALYLPAFYEGQNQAQLFQTLQPQFHPSLILGLLALPTLAFMLLSVLYAYLKLKRPVLSLLKEAQNHHDSCKNYKEMADLPFLQCLKKNTLHRRKILVFLVWFSAFCFASMLQMSMSMKALASDQFSFLMLIIGFILSFLTLFLALSSVLSANGKTIAMMKVMGYSQKETAHSLLSGYRIVSYLGFLIGTGYQYLLLKLTVTFVFADYNSIPEYHFNQKALLATLLLFLLAYECTISYFSRRISQLPVKAVMLE